MSDSYDTLPGTPEREKVLEDALRTVWGKELARKFDAAFSQSRPFQTLQTDAESPLRLRSGQALSFTRGSLRTDHSRQR